ncbi:MAG TPA: hypothetical protein VGK67_05430 [Myxococcales bacterium]|jgi:hypothetical protein
MPLPHRAIASLALGLAVLLAANATAWAEPDVQGQSGPDSQATHSQEPPPAPAPPETPPAAKPDLLLDIDIGLTFSLGEAPAISPGLSLGGHLRWDFFSLGLEARATLPVGAVLAAFPGGSLSAHQVTGALMGCGHYGFVAGCLVGTVGAVWFESRNVPDPRTDTKLASTLALRLQGEYPLMDWLIVRAHLDFGANLLRSTASVGGAGVWTTPAVFGLLGLGAAWRF